MGLFSSTPAPTLTEKTLPDQTGKVFIVTGASSGIGRELTEILYSHNARVYVAARSIEKANAAIEALRTKYTSSTGSLVFLHLNLNDLTTIKASATEFLEKEQRLDVLWNNAGVMIPDQGSKTAQGYELQLGTNNLAHHLFTRFLAPILVETVKSAPKGSVRVVWVASSAAKAFAPDHGVDMQNLDYKIDKGAWHKYGVSKAGNILQAKAFASRHEADGVVSVALDPGNLKTDLYRNMPKWQAPIANLVLKDPIYGAYTELYGGLSSDITISNTGAWIEPWGQIKTPRADIEKAGKTKEEGGSGVGEEFWGWCEKEVAAYL